MRINRNEWKRNVNYKWHIIHIYFSAACPYLFLPFISGYQKHQKMPGMPYPIEVLLTGHSEQSTATAVVPIYPEAENCTWPGTMAGVTERHGGHVSVTVGTVPALPWAACVHKNHAYHIAVTQHFASNLSNTGAFVCLTRSNPETKAVVQPEGYETLPDIHVHTYTLRQRNLWPLPCSLMSTKWDHYIFT